MLQNMYNKDQETLSVLIDSELRSQENLTQHQEQIKMIFYQNIMAFGHLFLLF